MLYHFFPLLNDDTSGFWREPLASIELTDAPTEITDEVYRTCVKALHGAVGIEEFPLPEGWESMDAETLSYDKVEANYYRFDQLVAVADDPTTMSFLNDLQEVLIDTMESDSACQAAAEVWANMLKKRHSTFSVPRF
jgi:hypothetical protein